MYRDGIVPVSTVSGSEPAGGDIIFLGRQEGQTGTYRVIRK